LKDNKWSGYGYPKKNHNVLKTIWAPFDKEDPTEWILIGFGMGSIVIMLLVGVFEWISQ
tara:strand:+ start:57 stop:233 length:177 start_codon:yes stop_codon:yes gene_type:complete